MNHKMWNYGNEDREKLKTSSVIDVMDKGIEIKVDK